MITKRAEKTIEMEKAKEPIKTISREISGTGRAGFEASLELAEFEHKPEQNTRKRPGGE